MSIYTTHAVGEEEPITSFAIGEEDTVTSFAIGEEELYTTHAIGEEGDLPPIESSSSPFGAF